ncbi:MAG: oligoendopeptidase F [Clostridiaceae bacterium]|nr:oligoendopeptidase F [Clostridiaceae bacterium]
MNNKSLKNREQIPEESKWKLNKIYADAEEWEKDFEELKKESPELKKFQGKLDDKEEILNYLNLNEKLSRKAEKLYVYANMKSHEDTTNQKNQSIMNKINGYMSEFGSYTAYVIPELLSLKEGFIENLINTDERFKAYEFLLKDILKEKKHVLTKEMEELMALVSDSFEAPSNIYSMLTNADLTFGKIKDEDGEEVELTEGNYSGFIKSKDRRVRKEAFDKLFSEYKKFENTISASLTASIKNFNLSARIRKYSSPLAASLDPNNIPLSVYEKAIETMDKNVSSLHRYVRLKKKLLGLDEIHMYDLYVPVIEIEKEEIPFEEGVKIANEALAPLGKEYLNIFNEGIKSGWIDIYQNKGKRSGAYSWGSYDTMPYVLLNYNFELNDVSTLVHEMGHSIHSYYSKKTQPYYYSNYTLFCAEVASTTNEAILINYLINKEQDKKKKLFLINQELEQIRTTVFRQLMFAEFELYSHNQLDKGEALTAEDYNKKWHELNVKYFGEDMVVDEGIDIEWARIPHFYTDFYVYQYATGYSAASAFANSILNKEENAVEKYKGFLKSGGSKYPVDILKDAGVDMTTPAPIEATIKRFNELLDMLEEL